jgi:hypothetical protein
MSVAGLKVENEHDGKGTQQECHSCQRHGHILLAPLKSVEKQQTTTPLLSTAVLHRSDIYLDFDIVSHWIFLGYPLVFLGFSWIF